MKVMKVFVSGCFDILHAGHIQFLKDASRYGNLYVSIGSDKTIKGLKGNTPFMNQDVRRFILESVKYVHKVMIGSSSGMLDFLPELNKIKPDIFVVNEDGDTFEKRNLCNSRKIKYIVLKRIPKSGLPSQNSSNIRKKIEK